MESDARARRYRRESRWYSDRRRGLLQLAMVVALVLSGCGDEANGSPESPERVDPGVPAMPEIMPADFTAQFSQDAGMAPWSEGVTIRADSATYTMSIDGLTLAFDYTPAPERIGALYVDLREGLFEQYEVVPFEEGEVIFDAESSYYRVEAGDVDHSIIVAGQDLNSPDTGRHPLRSLRLFHEIDSAPAADNTMFIELDGSSMWSAITIRFDLTGTEFAVGDERFIDGLDIAWSGDRLDVPVNVTAETDEAGEESEHVADLVVSFEPGGDLVVAAGGVGVDPVIIAAAGSANP
ncbi:MAG: hypothetical protein GY939_20605 [Actinomycetia bacterium]|nr:hypothetical protein [Actinomycetes bacterium]